jgi:hypothetical protein
MTTYFDLPLWIDWSDIENRAAYFKDDLQALDQDIKDSILQWVHDQLYLSADEGTNIKFKDNTLGGSPGSSQFPLAQLRQLQIALGAWGASFTIDNPAGTGSLAGVGIDSFQISMTMAKNNSTATDLNNANQYGTQAYQIWSQRPQTRLMVGNV